MVYLLNVEFDIVSDILRTIHLSLNINFYKTSVVGYIIILNVCDIKIFAMILFLNKFIHCSHVIFVSITTSRRPGIERCLSLNDITYDLSLLGCQSGIGSLLETYGYETCQLFKYKTNISITKLTNVQINVCLS